MPVWQMMRKNWYGFYICARSRWPKHRSPACCISRNRQSINANKKYWRKWKPFGCRKVHQRLIRLRNAFKLRIESTDIPFAWYSIVEYKEYSFDAGFDKIASIWFVGAPSVRISWSKQASVRNIIAIIIINDETNTGSNIPCKPFCIYARLRITIEGGHFAHLKKVYNLR